MKSLTRRSLFGGVAAAAVAAILPAREGQTYTFTAGEISGPPMLHIGNKAIDLSAADLRPGSIYWVSKEERKIVWVNPTFENGELVLYPAEQNLNRPGRRA